MCDAIRPTTPTSSPRARGLVAVVLVGGMLLAACGGGSGNPGIAAVASTTTTAAPAGATAPTPSGSSTATGGSAGGAHGSATSAAVQAGVLAFSKCMRASGVPNFPDPRPGGGLLISTGDGIDASSPAFKTAQAKCGKLMPGGAPPAPGAQTHPAPQVLSQMLKVAGCMRGHGVADFPDPRTSVPSNIRAALGGPGTVSVIDGVVFVLPARIEQSPLFVHAAKVCAFPLRHR